MRTYTWEEYYEKFYDWAESTQIRNLSYLTTLGDAEEVAEIITELQGNPPAANRLLKKAIAEGKAFSCDSLQELLCDCDEKLTAEAVRISAERLTEEDIEDLYLSGLDEEIVREICRDRHFPLPEDLREDYFENNHVVDTISSQTIAGPQRKKKKRSILAAIVGGMIGADIAERTSKDRDRQSGFCNGDCAHCPPHYGYRYGKWYYGHDHTYGCERGGNKGGGGL